MYLIVKEDEVAITCFKGKKLTISYVIPELIPDLNVAKIYL
jgi:hypothetical protein